MVIPYDGTSTSSKGELIPGRYRIKNTSRDEREWQSISSLSLVSGGVFADRNPNNAYVSGRKDINRV